MRRSVFLTLLLSFMLYPSTRGLAYMEKGKVEFSTSASFTNMRWHGESETALLLPVRVGKFLEERIEVEGEALFGTLDIHNTPGVLFSGLLSYHFTTRSSGEHNWAPFLLAGLGITNTAPLSTNVTFGGCDNYAAVLNFGAGIKTFFAEPVAVRWEYRFQHYTGDFDRTNHMVLMGVSVFLP
jgi:hypothetical protein